MHLHRKSWVMKSLTVLAVVLVAACAVDAPTTARSGQRALADWNGRQALPGSNQAFPSASPGPLNCIPKNPAYGSALIGPSGGELIIGPHRLIVPAGALTETVTISGTVPNDKPFEINLQPHGLQFRKAAGLILDASDCTSVPDIVYLIDQFTVSDPILATYSTWWHTVACPIWHFSGYSIAFHDDDSGASE